MSTAYLGLGSNLGDREANIRAALEFLKRKNITVLAVAPIYETEPVGFTEQPWFLNTAARVETNLSPQDLFRTLKEIEQEMGRTVVIPQGPRLIDLDLLLYDNLVINSPDLVIPHPRFHERAFVLRPLADIAPGVVHPRLKLRVKELLQRLPPGPAVRPWR